MDILTNFGVQPILLIAQAVNFLILLFILRKMLYKPMLKMLDERKYRIAQSVKHSEEIEQRLTNLEAERNQVLKKAQEESAQLLKETKAETTVLVAEAQARAKEQAWAIIDKARAQNTAEFAQMRQALKGEIADLVTMVAQKAVADVLTREQRETITKKAVQELQD